MLCYVPVIGWVAAVVFLAWDVYRREQTVRFHACQGLFLAVLWLLARHFFFPGNIHIFPLIGLRSLWKVLVLLAQVFGMIKTLQKQPYRLPVLGELAEKAMA